MEPLGVDDELLDRLTRLSDSGDPPPWTSSVEGRGHISGDTFIMIGFGGDRREDLYLSRDSGPVGAVTHDLVAEARNALLLLIREIKLLCSELAAR